MGVLMRNGINYSGSQLPTITTTDEGKVLTVNEDGEWAAAVPSGGGSTIHLVDKNTWDPASAVEDEIYLLYE